MDDDGARIVRVNRGAGKRADKPETDKKALGLFGDVPPAIEFMAQPPAGTTFAQEKPFIPMYGPETFSTDAGREALRQHLANRLGTAAVPAPVSAPSPPSAPSPLPSAATMVSSSTASLRSRLETSATPTPPPKPALILPIGQSKKASGPSLLEKLAELERKEKDGSPRSKPALQKPLPQPGTTIVKKAVPSLFIERKKPRKPAQKPAQTQKTPDGKGKEKDNSSGMDMKTA
ncbi:hypothetical protein MFIFM68171_01275 [Madurella fahalii]|uniref:Uncharacterized protein n=1 Tax=Madurella fahalii TaxID=1157608 RepID=A0ABQ0FZX8_9PEZI